VRAEFDVTVICPEGVALATSTTNHSADAKTSASYSGTVTIAGSARPKPIITITFSAATSVTQTSFQIGSEKVQLNNAITAGDVVVFNTESKKVTLNGTEKDYDGIFPLFDIGDNDYIVATNGSARTWNLDIDYNAMYL
jgi:hypothetical protein